MATWGENDPVVDMTGVPTPSTWGSSDPEVGASKELTLGDRVAAMRPEFLRGSGNPFSGGVAGRFMAGMLGLPMQTVENVVNLSKAAVGTVAGAMGRPDLMPSLVDLPGNVSTAARVLNALGLQTENPLPDDPAFRAANIAGGIAPSMAIPGATLGQTTLATGGAIAGREIGDDTGEMFGSMLPAAATSAYAKRRSPALAQKQQANTEADRITQAARDEGLVIPPVQTNPGSMTNQVLAGISGKPRTEMIFSNKNQPVVNEIVRRDLGMEQGASLTDQALSAIRNRAGEAYQRVKDYGSQVRLQMKPDKKFNDDIKALGGDFGSIRDKFPDIAKTEGVEILRNALDGKSISPLEAIELTKKLRKDASSNYRSMDDPGKAELAKAQKDAANAVEGLLERFLMTSRQATLVKDFREARQLIAKTYDVEAALKGGDVNARVLARAVKDDRPFTGGLKTIAEAADKYETAFRPPNPSLAQQFSVFDAGLAFPGSGALFGMGQPGAAAAAAAFPFVRYLTRQAMTTPLYQRTLGTPDYTPMVTPDAGLASILRGVVSMPMTQVDPTLEPLQEIRQMANTYGVRG